jgi:tetratricopeptide (TPR) repeat protein
MQRAAVRVALVAVVVALYGRTAGFGFLNFDDPLYVLDNPHVNAGVTPDGVVWAFTQSHAANWHPVTWISHMVDCEVFGLWAGGHHLVSVGIHALNALLLLSFLHRLTGNFWRSALVATFFAWHPTRVESVAWIAERKDVLSTACWLAAAHAYLRYVARPTVERGLVVAGAFAAGLLAKPMVVTAPVVFLLLDYWPLRRSDRGWTRLVSEKLPLFALATAASVATVLAQHAGNAVVGLDQLSPASRVANAVVSYVRYLGLIAWPSELAIQYPYRLWSPGVVAVAALVLLAVSVAAFALRARAPYLLVGWLWYVVMLAPVSGVVQVGSQALADRFTYLSAVGVWLAAVWGIGDLLVAARAGRAVPAALALALALAQLPLTARQVEVWRESKALFAHALDVGGPSALAHTQLGLALGHEGRRDEAKEHYEAALLLNPRHAGAHANLANILADRGNLDEAMAHYLAAIAADPELSEAHNGLGLLLGRGGHDDAAVASFERALAARPDYPEAHSNLANSLRGLRRLREALVHYAAAARLRPEWADVHFGWGMTLLAVGDTRSAVERLEHALRVDPASPAAAMALAWVRATSPEPSVRDGTRAVTLAESVLATIPAPAAVDLDTLAATYAEAGRYADATATATKAIELARRAGDEALAALVEGRRALYAAGRPFHTNPAPPVP